MSEPPSLYDRDLDSPGPHRIPPETSIRSGLRVREWRYVRVQLIVATAIAAVIGWVAWSVAVERWRDDYSARAAEHARAELFFTSYPEPLGPARARYHAGLKQKYIRATDRPWLPVAPDPPPPE